MNKKSTVKASKDVADDELFFIVHPRSAWVTVADLREMENEGIKYIFAENVDHEAGPQS